MIMNSSENGMILPTYFISHGGGPWFWMDEQRPLYANLERSLRAMPQELGATPKAILIVSGHWEEEDFTVMTSPQPSMHYDYSGFPAHTYQVKYDAPGAPKVARRVAELLESTGIAAREDEQRGFNHGTFVPLAAAYPAADVPVLELSIQSDYDPETHLAAGRAIAPLRREGVLIVASGLSYHNMRGFGTQAARVPSHEFDGWLTETLGGSVGETRSEKLRRWTAAPSARLAHPREDHLIPLMVAVGAAEAEKGERIYHEDAFFGDIAVSSYRFGASDNPV